MIVGVDLTLFAHVVSRPESELDLAEAALLVAATEHPDVDVPRYLAMLDDLGERARRRLAAPPIVTGERALQRILTLLYQELGFRGNTDDYYDPRNSFLDDALDRKTGIPITLAVILIEVCRRAGLEACGVSFPGHFLVRIDRVAGQTAPVLIDPFEGKLLERAALRALLARAGGEAKDPDPRLLEPAAKRAILIRMLNNLRGIYTSRSDRDRLRAVLERLVILAPSDELRQELQALGGSRPWRPTGGRALN